MNGIFVFIVLFILAVFIENPYDDDDPIPITSLIFVFGLLYFLY